MSCGSDQLGTGASSQRSRSSNSKALYRRLRSLPADQLWSEEMPRFNQAPPGERLARVALVRAVGAAFAQHRSTDQKEAVRTWLRNLLDDPAEKIRRYAIAALPKLGPDARDEAALLALLRSTHLEREKKFLQEALGKIGGAATLEQFEPGSSIEEAGTEQKVKANVARRVAPSALEMHRVLKDVTGLRIHLRCRSGLEEIVREEVEHCGRGKFRFEARRKALVSLVPTASFSLDDIFAWRCFATVGFVLGAVSSSAAKSIESLAALIASPLMERIMSTFTEGSLRYRLDFVAEGHQRGLIDRVAARAYALCPRILNDPRKAPWVVVVRPAGNKDLLELTPRRILDPRFRYRQSREPATPAADPSAEMPPQAVPAASHPPLAACLARFAGRAENEVVWDPFCGSGLELIERVLLGSVRTLVGTDHDPTAISAAERNFASAGLPDVAAQFFCCDFHDWQTIPGLRANGVSLILTNPPMGRRVPVPDLRVLIEDLFAVAAVVLRPGGRLVLANPLRQNRTRPGLKLQSEYLVDLGGFHCRLQKYVKRPEQG